MRYVEVIDTNGNTLTLDLWAPNTRSCFKIGGNRKGFDTPLIIGHSTEENQDVVYYGILKEFNCKDDTFEEKQKWFKTIFDEFCEEQSWNSVHETIYNDEELLSLYAKKWNKYYREGYYETVVYSQKIKEEE